jgi:hypothetical protein
VTGNLAAALLAIALAACAQAPQTVEQNATQARMTEGKELFEEKCATVAGEKIYRKVENDLVEMFDAVGTQDWSNCKARADVVVDGKVVVPQAPVTFLLFLEKQLTNLRNFVEKLPVRDGGEDWSYQQEAALYVTPNVQTQVTAKVQEALVLYPATEQHPAQCQMISKDVVAGYWENRKFSGAISKQDQDKLVERVKKFSEAVKTAREEANHVEADSVRVGGSILDYIFSGVIK